MNRFFFFLLAFMVTSAMNAEQVTKQAALQKAKQFMPGKNFTVAKSRSLSRGVDPQTEEADFYILNADNGGYVIVSGDDRTREILGYSEQGNLDIEKAPDNLKWWLDEYARQIETIKSLPKGTTRTASSLPKSSWPAISPLISAKWSQYEPFNYMCPDANGKDFDEDGYDPNNRCVTGCTATALAQVMYYWKWPENCPALNGYIIKQSSINEYIEKEVKGLPATSFKWEKMKDSYTYGETGEAANAVAELMRYCGHIAHMYYGTDGSGGIYIQESFPLVGYSKNTRVASRYGYTASQWESLIYEELAAGRPVAYSGFTKFTGHSFVVDGYDGNGLFHINFGWRGSCDEYYLLTLYENEQVEESPELTKDERLEYYFFQEAVLGLKPSEPNEELMPEIKSNLEKFLTKEYTRTNSSVDFANVILPFDISVWYNSLPEVDHSVELGWGIYKDDIFIKCIGSQNDIIQASLVYNSDGIYGGGLSNDEDLIADFGADLETGRYQLYQVYRFHDNENWIRCTDFGKSLIAEVSSTKLTLRLTDKYGMFFTVNSITYSDPLIDYPITVKVNVTNNGDWELLMLNLWIQKQGSDSWINVAQGRSSILFFKDDSDDIEMSFTLHEPGTYNLKVTNCSSDKALKTVTMIIEPDVDMVVDHVKYRCSPAVGAARVIKNKDNYDDYGKGKSDITSITILPTITANGVECKVKTIDEHAFENLSNVCEINIPEGIESIRYCAFEHWYSLEHLTIPSTVKEIGQYAFGYTHKLKTVTSYMREPPFIYPDVFKTGEYDSSTNTYHDYFPAATLYVPAGCAKKYGDAYTWKEFTNIIEMPSTVKGDADGDGDVTLKDVELVKEYIMTGKTEGLIFTNADINGDEKLNVIDIVYILNIIKN